MAFCGNCGANMEANERFCVKCGRDNTIQPAAVPVATPVAVAPPPPAPPAPPVAPHPGMYAAPPGAIPIGVPVPVPVQPKKSGAMGSIIVLAILAAGGYYYYTQHKPPDQNPPAAQAPGGGEAPGGGAPPAGGAPAAAPGANAALAKQQAFDAHWQTVNGMIQLSNGTWKNNGTVAVQSATLECDQYDASGNVLDMMRTTLNGPVAPGATDGFSPFWMGAVAANLNKVTCTIVHVKQPGQ